MTDNIPVPDTARDVLLKRIDGKLAWICFFLIVIALNTCSVAKRLEQAVLPERVVADGIPNVITAEPAPAPPEEK